MNHPTYGKALSQPEQPAAKTRSAFEAWYCQAYNLAPDDFKRFADGMYLDPSLNADWDVWQAALAQPVQPEQEPWKCVCGANLYIDENGKPRSKASQQETDWEAVAADQAMTIALMKSEQEPVAFLCHGNLFMWPSEDGSCGNPEDHIPLYASPPQREWVGLTRDEKFEIINRLLGEDWVYTLDAAQDLLQKKNT